MSNDKGKDDNVERLENFKFSGGEEQAPQQAPATHVAIDVELHKNIIAFFQNNQSLTWAQSNPFVVGLLQGKAMAMQEQKD